MSKHIRNAVGENIRIYRERRGMTRIDLADAMHVSPKTVGNWERGDRDPSSSYLSAIAKVLDVQKSDLIGETNLKLESTIHHVMQDDSMSPEIMPGDTLVVNYDTPVQDGDIVLVEVTDKENNKTKMIRRLVQIGKQMALLALNTSIPTIHANGNTIHVQGKVTELNRQIGK